MADGGPTKPHRRFRDKDLVRTRQIVFCYPLDRRNEPIPETVLHEFIHLCGLAHPEEGEDPTQRIINSCREKCFKLNSSYLPENCKCVKEC